jgi:hypothetical protein
MPTGQPVLVESFYIHRNSNPLNRRFEPKLLTATAFHVLRTKQLYRKNDQIFFNLNWPLV